MPTVDNREIFSKLEKLFAQASDLVDFEVSWDTHPLPQMLVELERRDPDRTNPQGSNFSLQPAALIELKAERRAPAKKYTASAPGKVICNCNKQFDDPAKAKEIHCADAFCKVAVYHAACVGLVNREHALTWRCADCRMCPSVLAPHVPLTQHEEEPPLTQQQANVVDLILAGGNVCYTGSAGTGKSTVLKAVKKALRNQGKHVDVIAPSGIAAIAVNGQTTFAYAGWVPDTLTESLDGIKKKTNEKLIRKRLCSTDVLIIEEISMVDSHFFQRLDCACREARGTWSEAWIGSGLTPCSSELPFGGMQVVVTGDFCQLPPVRPFKYCLYCKGDELPGWKTNRTPITCPECDVKFKDSEKWAFQNEAWEKCAFICVELTENHRQSDEVFTSILQKCRRCIPFSENDRNILLNHQSYTEDAVKLRPRVAEVLEINEARFRSLPGATSTYECVDMFNWRREQHPELSHKQWRRRDGKYKDRRDGPLLHFKDHRFEEVLQLKVDTLVILLVNMDTMRGLVNGSQGRVVGFQPYSPDGVSQPTSIEEPSSFLPTAMGEHNTVRDAQAKLFAQNASEWPIVQFNNGVKQVVYPHCQLSELGVHAPYSLEARTQIPLLPAWAITIHKSQGMTLSRVEVDLAHSFERGMAYVALSRAKTLIGLKVLNLPMDRDRGPDATIEAFLKRFKPASSIKVNTSARKPTPGQHPIVQAPHDFSDNNQALRHGVLTTSARGSSMEDLFVIDTEGDARLLEEDAGAHELRPGEPELSNSQILGGVPSVTTPDGTILYPTLKHYERFTPYRPITLQRGPDHAARALEDLSGPAAHARPLALNQTNTSKNDVAGRTKPLPRPSTTVMDLTGHCSDEEDAKLQQSTAATESQWLEIDYIDLTNVSVDGSQENAEERPCEIVVDRSQIPPGTKKFYGVRKGRQRGIFYSWHGSNGAEAQVTRYPGPIHKSFKSLEEALHFVNHDGECWEHCCKEHQMKMLD